MASEDDRRRSSNETATMLVADGAADLCQA
jgi:hypothetical protein